MGIRKHHYTASEVATLIGSDVNVVYTALKEGKIKGHKCRSGKWLIPKEQENTSASLSIISGKEKSSSVTEPEHESFIRYIADEEHYTEVFSRMNTVKHSLKLATGDLKNFNVYFSAELDTEPVRFGEFLQLLLNRSNAKPARINQTPCSLQPSSSSVHDRRRKQICAFLKHFPGVVCF